MQMKFKYVIIPEFKVMLLFSAFFLNSCGVYCFSQFHLMFLLLFPVVAAVNSD